VLKLLDEAVRVDVGFIIPRGTVNYECLVSLVLFLVLIYSYAWEKFFYIFNTDLSWASSAACPFWDWFVASLSPLRVSPPNTIIFPSAKLM